MYYRVFLFPLRNTHNESLIHSKIARVFGSSRGKGRSASLYPYKNLTSRFRSYFFYIRVVNITSLPLCISSHSDAYFRANMFGGERTDWRRVLHLAGMFRPAYEFIGGHSLNIRRGQSRGRVGAREKRYSSLSLSLFFPRESCHVYLHKTYLSIEILRATTMQNATV